MSTPTPDPAPWSGFRPRDAREHIALRAASDPDVFAWLRHIAPAAGCTRPIRLAGHIAHHRAATGRLLANRHTAAMPDGVIYKAVRQPPRLASARPAPGPTSATPTSSSAPASSAAKASPTRSPSTRPCSPPSPHPRFGSRPHPPRHQAHLRDREALRLPRRTLPRPPRHRPVRTRQPAVVLRPPRPGDRRLGQPLCLDCYDHDHQVVWNLFAGNCGAAPTSRRTPPQPPRHAAAASTRRHRLHRRGPTPDACRTSGSPTARPPNSKRRGAVHFHALIRLDGVDPTDPTAVVPPPAGYHRRRPRRRHRHAAAHSHGSPPRRTPTSPPGWRIVWGEQLDIKTITLAGDGDDHRRHGRRLPRQVRHQVHRGHRPPLHPDHRRHHRHPTPTPTATTPTASSTPAGASADLRSARFRSRSVHDRPDRSKRFGPRWNCPTCGTGHPADHLPDLHTDRRKLRLTPQPPRSDDDNPYTRLRRWAHMLGFGGHFLTKARPRTSPSASYAKPASTSAAPPTNPDRRRQQPSTTSTKPP